jgi:hypothetical protein
MVVHALGRKRKRITKARRNENAKQVAIRQSGVFVFQARSRPFPPTRCSARASAEKQNSWEDGWREARKHDYDESDG